MEFKHFLLCIFLISHRLCRKPSRTNEISTFSVFLNFFKFLLWISSAENLLKHMKYQCFLFSLISILCWWSMISYLWKTFKNQRNINTFCVPWFLVNRQSCLLTRNTIKPMKYQHVLCSQNPSSWNTHKNQWNFNVLYVPFFLVYRQSCLLIRNNLKPMKYQHFLCSQNPSSWKTFKNQLNINTFCVFLCVLVSLVPRILFKQMK